MKSIFLIIISCVYFSCVSTIPNQEAVGTGVTNISNMFNERGFYKSNGFSFDEQEIINDFNGNLIYNIPLYNFALAGDVGLDLSLNYNGSVGHQFFLNNGMSSYNSDPHRYSLNAAEWIISLNGIAIQTLNFETNFFTNPIYSPSTGDSVKLLIPGYHFDGPLMPATVGSPNSISILAGDGSVIILVNKSGDNIYEGAYAYEGKELHYKAQVKNIESGSPGYTRRKIELMKGDGAVYEFVEYKRNFYDFPAGDPSVTANRQPMMLLLEKIKDEFGHVVSIIYDKNVPDSVRPYGRPIVDSVIATGYSNNPIRINFAYGLLNNVNNIAIQNTSEVNGDYFFHLKSPVTLYGNSTEKNHKGYIEFIRNPLLQVDSLKYQTYLRGFNNLPSTLSDVDVSCNLNRLSYFRNNLKKRTFYTYVATNQPELTYSTGNPVLKSSGNNYRGYGRDLFYTNMLSSKTEYDNQTLTANKYFDYFFDPVNNPDANIDTSHIYESSSLVVSLNPLTVNNSEDSVYHLKSYKNFPIDSIFNNYLEEPDIQGIVKLMYEYSFYNYKNNSQTPPIRIEQNNYDYEKGNHVGKIFNGSFLMLSKINYMNSIPRLWTYSYTYKDGNYDSVLTSSTETDPLLNSNKTTYINFYKTVVIHKRMSNFLNEVQSEAFNDTSVYYKIHLPKTEEKLNQLSQVISTVSYDYIIDTNDNNGYYGQLRNKKQFNNINNNVNDFILTEFEYYKNDFYGNDVYTGDFYPFKEGNIKLIRNPNGEITKYFYTPQTPSEVEQPIAEIPMLLYNLKYNNNSTVQTSENIWDGRFPVRTDSYKENGISTDTLSVSYKSYAIDGSPTKLIGWNKYASVINYEPVHRVSSVILPGDFTDDSSTFTIKYNYNNANNFIYILSYRNTINYQYSKLKYSVNGFADVKEKNVFTSETDSNSFTYSFNYMNKPSDNTDAMGNKTKFSYDGLGRLTRTENADGSKTFNSYTYQNTLSNYFGGNYTGFIEQQVYTDEVGNHFEKYFDAVGNLLQELKYEYEIPSDEQTITMITNYQYDSLYRLTKVMTPEGKYIYYSYDGFGRQSQRTTPDAGLTTYTYDKNNNLTFSQDANQKSNDVNKNTFRNYDGINRLTGVGENVFIPDSPTDGGQFVPTSPDLYLTLNVYDTLANDFVNIFFPPADYYSKPNFTKGNLTATAYRTRVSDNWSFKYYRYDERSRVIKMWNLNYGLIDKEITYQYNSQDQITQVNFGNETEYKRYSYYYDFAGRLGTLNYANSDPTLFPIEKIDKAAPDINFSTYTYNPNSLIDFQFYNSSQLQNQYRYNSRNWITEMNSIEGLFGFQNTYFRNGNLEKQFLFGTYKDYMQNRYNLYYTYTYDNSNRLLNAVNSNQGDLTYSTYNTYDKDGNITTLQRYGDNNIVKDNFNYVYTSGTNKLARVSGATDQFSHDLNGNTILDELNGNYNILYDHRNLITELYHLYPNSETPYTTATRYYYDESGNRVRKLTYFNTQYDPLPVIEWNNLKNPGNNWQLLNNEFYVKGADGKDLATYEGQDLQEWFVWGNDIVGKIKGDKNYYYFKDHLGSVRVVVDNTGAIVSGIDYDAWGNPLENRNYNGDSIKYKYTGKEFDKESFYDYFGARYYDARVGRWGTSDPLLNKYPDISPYSYTLNNPLVLTDPTGLWVADFNSQSNSISVTAEEGDNLQGLYNQLGISADDFAKTYDINDINNFNVESGVSNFDITNYVLANTKFDASFTGSNCHGFVYISKGLNENEVTISGHEIGLKISNMNGDPLTGDIAIFEIDESFYIYDFLIPKGEPGHSAIFVIQNKSGEKQFLNRIGSNEKVTLNSENQINLYQQDIARRNRQFGANISSSAKYYRGIEK